MVTTLGYLNYCQDRNAISFARLSFLIFDEADELFNANFSRAVQTFMIWAQFIKPTTEDKFARTTFHPNCQIMMFAADFEPEIEQNAKHYFRNYKQTVKIAADTQQGNQGTRKTNTSINEKILQEIVYARDYVIDEERDPNRTNIVRDLEKNQKLFDRVNT